MDEALSLERSLPDWPLERAPRSSRRISSCGRERSSGRTASPRARAGAQRRGDVPGQADALWYLALTAWRAGSWEDADRYAADAPRADPQVGIEARRPTRFRRRSSTRIWGASTRHARGHTPRSTGPGRRGCSSESGVQLGARPSSSRSATPAQRCHTCGALTSCATRLRARAGHALRAGRPRRGAPRGGGARGGRSVLGAVEARARALDRTWALAVIERGRGLAPRDARRPRRCVRRLRAGARRARRRHGSVPARPHAPRARPDAAPRQAARCRARDARGRPRALRDARRTALGRADARRARPHRRPDRLPGRADRGGAPDRPARRRGPAEPRGRRGAVPHGALGRDRTQPDLSQARDPVPRRARARPLKELRFPAFRAGGARTPSSGHQRAARTPRRAREPRRESQR